MKNTGIIYSSTERTPTVLAELATCYQGEPYFLR